MIVIHVLALNGLLRSVLPDRFAACPPAFGLLLYLRKALRQHAPEPASLARVCQTLLLAATGAVRLPQRSQGGARRAEDMSGGRRTAPVASADVICGCHGTLVPHQSNKAQN
jgi:hypothetical protein